jgi:deoxyribodipyrimidine photo-lyase
MKEHFRARTIQPERIKILNSKETKRGRYILYWMQASQRAGWNHALEYAVQKANGLNQPLVVFFGITNRFPEANERHYAFMLEGLRETQQALEQKGIQMVIQPRSPEKGVADMAGEASLVVTDRGYLRIQRQWREAVARKIDVPLVQVESDVIIPIEETSDKEEFAAATIRPKILRKLGVYLIPVREDLPKRDSLGMAFDSVSIDDLTKAIASLSIDRTVGRVDGLHGGTKEAERYLDDFIDHKLDHFAELRNDPNLDTLSNMSPYLHFGQISPLPIALRISRAASPGKEAYLEELIVRRELSMNYVFYNPQYDSFEGLPEWTRKTLLDHRKDVREYTYTLKDLEGEKTHDPYWNAAQKEMRVTGKMHGYMRMYWGKKILEWSRTHEEGFKNALSLNNKYELDGRDPNGFTGVAWCFGKHDRPWGERKIFGKVRYMNAAGLKRKFDIEGYVRKVDLLQKNREG